MTEKQTGARSRALAAELSKLRHAAGLSTREAARQIGISAASLNRSELGTRMPSPEEVSALLVVYQASMTQREQVMDIARKANSNNWWEITGHPLPQQLPALITFESQASRIVHFEPLLVPGLLQTHAYARAVMESGGIPDEAAENRVSARVGRQTVLTKPYAPRYLAILDEAALRRPFGGRAVMAQQLQQIVGLSHQPNITVQVIPFERGGYPIYGPFALHEYEHAAAIVYLEHKQTVGFLDKRENTQPFQQLTDTLKAVALSPAETSEFLTAIAADYNRE